MTGAHAAAVLAIYQAGIEEGNATFETRAPDWAAFTADRLPAHRPLAQRRPYRAPQPGGRPSPRTGCPPTGRWRDVVLIERRSPAL